MAAERDEQMAGALDLQLSGRGRLNQQSETSASERLGHFELSVEAGLVG